MPPAPASDNTGEKDRVDLVLRALASKPRREILRLLAAGAGAEDQRCCSAEEICACVFSEKLGLGAPTISHHMKTLVDAGLVEASKQGLWVYYRLRPDTIAEVTREICAMVGCEAGSCGR